MKSIQTALIIWFVFGAVIRAHQVHKRMLGDPELSPHTDTASQNETSGLPHKDEFIKVSILTEDPTDIGKEAEKNTKTGSSTSEMREPLSALQSKTEPGSHIPAIISTDSDYHFEQDNSTLASPIVPIPIDKISSDYLPLLKRQISKSANVTTSVLSELESEIGLLFEIAEGAEHKHDFSSKSGDSAEEVITVVIHPDATNKSEGAKSEVQIDEVPFFEGFSPFIPIESFFSHLFRPQEAVIIETDSFVQRPSHNFANANNSEPAEKEHASSAEEAKPKK